MKHIVIYLVLILIASYLGFRLSTQKNKVESKEQVIQEKNAVIKTWKDKTGKWRAEKQAANVTISDLKQELDSVKEIDDNTQSYTGVGTETKDSISTEIKWKYDTIENNNVDTVYAGIFEYRDKWSKFSGKITDDKINFNYSINDSIELITEWRSQGWFKPDQLYVEGKSYNPNTKINWIRNYTVKNPPEDKFAVVVGTGGALTTKGIIFTPINITVGYKLFGL